MRRLVIGIVFSVGLVLTGCGREHELQNVAKDWCVTIRASQVIPVYPLTEDLQPGDVFLVTTPIRDQARQYKQRGFLPLDMHIARLSGLDYKYFYQKSYGINDNNDTPHHWQFPKKNRQNTADGGSGSNTDEEDNKQRHSERTDWASAPRVSFPSYTFKVRSDAGLALALPLQGVPVGLNLMQTNTATGSVTIADAYVYAVSLNELREKVKDWATEPSNRLMLSQLRANTGKSEELYLRVVNRVYLTGSVVVSLTRQKGLFGGGSVGQAQEVNLLDVNSVEKYREALQNINTEFGEIPGGTLKFAHVTSRGVTMSEEFDRPLVIGYLGFDFPILEDGWLGPPVATQKQIKGIKQPVGQFGKRLKGESKAVAIAFISLIHHGLKTLASDTNVSAKIQNNAAYHRDALNSLADVLPEKYTFTGYQFDSGKNYTVIDEVQTGKLVNREDFDDVIVYLANIQEAIEIHEEMLSVDGLTVDGEQPTDLKDEIRKQLDSATKAKFDITEPIEERPSLIQATQYYFNVVVRR